MTYTAFIFAVLALLLTPGPTNTLIAVAAAQGRLRSTARLLPAELLGYFLTVLPLTVLGTSLSEGLPSAAVLVKTATAGWLIYLAAQLWKRQGGLGGTGQVTVVRILITTMLNPKALIFGLVLLPAPAAGDFPAKIALFCIMVVAVGVVWGAFGQVLYDSRSEGVSVRTVRRIASVWLAVVSATLIFGIVHG